MLSNRISVINQDDKVRTRVCNFRRRRIDCDMIGRIVRKRDKLWVLDILNDDVMCINDGIETDKKSIYGGIH